MTDEDFASRWQTTFDTIGRIAPPAMTDDDDLPVSFDLLLWGSLHPKVLKALKRTGLPEGVAVSAGPAGASLKIPLAADPSWVEQLLSRLERAQLEGGVQVGLLPDRPLSGKQLRDEWASALRTRKVAVPLTRRQPLESPGPDWLD